MNSDERYVSQADTKKFMSLITEYSEKLRALCENYSASRARRLQSVFMILAINAAFLGIGAIYIQITFNGKPIPEWVLLYAFALFFIGLFSILVISIRSYTRTRNQYDVHQVAITVERLLRTASQYREHSRWSIADEFEFDIRLAEGEAALRFYSDLFNRSNGLSSETFSIAEKVVEAGSKTLRF